MSQENFHYHVEEYKTAFFSGTINAQDLQAVITRFGNKGWRLVRTIQERKRIFFFFSREVHLLIFERPFPSSESLESLPEGW